MPFPRDYIDVPGLPENDPGDQSLRERAASSAFDRYPTLWRWTPAGFTDDERLYGDIADEYAVVQVESEGNPSSVMLLGRYGGRWFKNPPARVVLAELLSRVLNLEVIR